MTSRRKFIRRSSFGLLGAPLLPGLFQGNQEFRKLLDDPGQDPFEILRDELLLEPGLIYMNTATLGPTPKSIVDGVLDLTGKLEKNPAVMNWGELGKEMENTRDIIAQSVGCQKDEVLLTRNTTEGLSLVISQIDLKQGDEILTTNHEHGGGYLGPEYMVKHRGAIMKKMKLPLPVTSKQEILDLVEENLTDRTKVVLLSHVSTVDGLKMPLGEISQLTRPKGIFLLADGAQAPGQVEVNVKELGVDAYATSGHKWLLGPKETGYLYIRREKQSMFNPIFTHSGFQAYSASSGTRNAANIIGLGETIKMHDAIGFDRIGRRCLRLKGYCQDKLGDIRELKVISPTSDDLSCGIVSVDLLDKKNGEVATELKNRGIIVKLLPNYNALRFSCHIFNNEGDIDTLCENLDEILNS